MSQTDPFGQTKEVAQDHPDWMQYMTKMQAQDPNPVSLLQLLALPQYHTM